KALGAQHIQTVSGRGYRFVTEVRTVDRASRTTADAGGWQQRLESARAALVELAETAFPTPPSPGHVVGRRKERADLFAGWETIKAGPGLVLSISGEPGIGKTTLVSHFLEELAARGERFTLAIGCCSERLAASEAFLPVLEALESLLSGPAGPAIA